MQVGDLLIIDWSVQEQCIEYWMGLSIDQLSNWLTHCLQIDQNPTLLDSPRS